MGDFLGFSFGGVHSSDLGITRVSGGDRYDEQLHPEIKDRTAEVPGLNGEYYFGSNYGPKTFDLEIAFDSLTEEQFRKLRTIFGTREIKDLIFDERPYKKYLAKIENPIELSYVCFDEPKKTKGATITEGGIRVVDRDYAQDNIIYASTDRLVLDFDMTKFIPAFPDNGTYVFTYQSIEEDSFDWTYEGQQINLLSIGITCTGIPIEGDIITVELFTKLIDITREDITPYIVDRIQTQRIYKGEGKFSFVCYFPFAKSNFKVLPEPGYKFYEGSKDWAISSGIISQTIRDLHRIDICDMNTNISIDPVDSNFTINDAEVFKNQIRHTGIFHFSCIEEDGSEEWYYDESSYPISLNSFGITCNNPVAGSVYTVTYTEAGTINIYNAGDLSTGFCLYLSADCVINGLKLSYKSRIDSGITAELYINPITIKPYGYLLIENPTGNPKTQGYYEFINKRYVLTQDTTPLDNKSYYEQKMDIGILIDTNVGLIQGVKEVSNSHDIYNNNLSYITSGTIYNECVNKGYFFNLVSNQSYTDEASLKITNLGGDPITGETINIFYDYLYY